MEITRFGILDYVIFLISLSISAGIGIYFGCFGSKQRSASEYLYGNNKMKAIPVGLSLYSSAISAVSIIGIPSEVYTFGTQYLVGVIGILLGLIIVWYIFLPIFCGNLDIKTPYEYFERRFGKEVRLISSFIYVFHTLLYMPMVLHASTLAITKVTGIQPLLCTCIIGGICILYTAVGGFKSVIWTDTLQATLMMGSCLTVAIVGVYKAGGINIVWQRAQAGNRIEFFNMDPNPFSRMTFWSAVIGMSFVHASHSGGSASALQRYMCFPNQKQARIGTAVGALGSSMIIIIAGIMGLAMYGLFYCNTEQTEMAGVNPKSIVPYFVSNVVNIPGFSGFFNAGVLSAGLSSLSAELNTVGGIIYHDFIMKYFRNKFTEARGAFVMKMVVLTNGILYLFITHFYSQSKYIFELALGICGITYGAKLGILLLGILYPKANSKGVVIGALLSMAIVGWIISGAHYYHISEKYASTIRTNCNSTTVPSTQIPLNRTQITNLSEPEPLFIYKLSYSYYALVGTVVTVGVGVLVSYITGGNDVNKLDPLLIAPFLRPYINKQQSKETEMQNIALKCNET